MPKKMAKKAAAKQPPAGKGGIVSVCPKSKSSSRRAKMQRGGIRISRVSAIKNLGPPLQSSEPLRARSSAP